jgi:hypothetical protein
MAKVKRDLPSGDRAQLLLEQILQQAVVARVEPDAALSRPVVAFRTTAKGRAREEGWINRMSGARFGHVTWTHDVGDESQICLLGGCLLMT